MHGARGYVIRQPKDQTAEPDLDMDRRSLGRGAEGFHEPESLGVKAHRALDITHVEINLRIAKRRHQASFLASLRQKVDPLAGAEAGADQLFRLSDLIGLEIAIAQPVLFAKYLGEVIDQHIAR